MIIFQRKIPLYRKEIFERISFQRPIRIFLLSKPKFNLRLSKKSSIKVIKNIEIFNFYIFNFKHFLLSKEKIFILEADLRFTLLFIFLILQRKKVFLWGIWKTKNLFANLIRKLLVKFTYGTIFYSNKHKQSFLNIKSKNMILAKNTLFVKKSFTLSSSSIEFEQRDSFLFVGSLNKRKNLDLLIKAWKLFKDNRKIKSNFKLKIIGDGIELRSIKKLVMKNNLSDSIFFLGNIDDQNLLNKHYSKALASLCLGQSGLSIVQSLLFGVPFICFKDCHSGGEIENIINGETGFLCTDLKEFNFRLNQISKGVYRDIYSKVSDYALRNLMVSDMIEALSLYGING